MFVSASPCLYTHTTSPHPNSPSHPTHTTNHPHPNNPTSIPSQVEREGVSLRYPFKPILIGTFCPDGGDLSDFFLDKARVFGFGVVCCVSMHGHMGGRPNVSGPIGHSPSKRHSNPTTNDKSNTPNPYQSPQVGIALSADAKPLDEAQRQSAVEKILAWESGTMPAEERQAYIDQEDELRCVLLHRERDVRA